ncbi:TPR and ankyrin repeat-containing protein 1-like [Mercenaria mercenaria]|uniref:TPR and ankyrin repeat-containing protein 1-like n=1 Tax=Mercenaria mercenaria TaxID=6596 RepID=UPI00234E4CD4|nr:TPR and ankyrin repeat-containing protein 1-like [Mercenaria mercenaria]
MSHRPRGGGGQYRPRKFNDQERQQYRRCMDLGMPYPPDPQQVYVFIQTLKKDAESALNNHHLEQALSLYTTALMGFQLFPRIPHIAEEHHKLLCNRSLVFLRMRRFKEAESDAVAAINSCPSFVKGYWRACQAVKGGYNGIQKAMPYLVNGLRKAMHGEGNQHDIVTFLAEICILVTRAPQTEAMENLLMDEMEIPDEEDEVWTKVVHKLASQNQWESISLLLTGYNEGVSSDLENIEVSTWKCDDLNIGVMLKSLTDTKIQAWGEDLAVALIDMGASVEKIGHQFGMPTLLYVVKLSLRLGVTELLSHILKEYERTPEKKDEVDNDGSTALHVVVKSKMANPDHSMVVLEYLLDAKCDASITDRNNKKPIDYVREGEKAHDLLRKAAKPVGELRKDLEVFKSQGNAALKSGKHQEALKFYEKAIKISQQSKQLYKEAAIVYSNKANVHCTLKNYTEALTNALAAISCDSAYHKGHWWKAKVLLCMGSTHDAFGAYMDGYIKSEVSSDTKFSFLMEAVTLLKNIPGEHFINCYNQLRFLSRDIWPQVLGRLSRNTEWKCIAYLILGPNLEKQRFGKKVTSDSIEEVCTGVANFSPTVEVQTNTVFQYLDKCDPKKEGPWLDAVLFAVYYHGNVQTLKCLAQDDNDCPIHAAVRFALKTGRTSLIEEFPGRDQDADNLGENAEGDSVYHCITKLRPPPEAKILSKVTEIMMKKGLSVMARDASGKLAVEYLDNKYPGYVFDIFFKATKSHTVDDINKLKEEGNAQFKCGNVQEAIELYGKAINIFKSSKAQAVHAKVTNHEIAVLYGNRAEGFLKLKMYQQAFEDAMESVSFDGHWYKAHIRVGKALKGMKKLESALKAFVNAYKDVDAHVEDTVKVEILIELATVCSNIPKSVLDVKKRIQDIPVGHGHIWARACYELVSKDDWVNAAVAHHQYVVGNARRPHLTFTLKPFCNLTRLREHVWGVDMLLYFLECGCNRKTITLENGDTYLHAVVRMTLLVARNLSLLQYLTKQYCKLKDIDQHKLDNNNNTVLHTAAREPRVDKNRRYDVIILLLKCQVDPNQKNRNKDLALEYLPEDETQSREALRMAMYNKENISKLPSSLQSSKEFSQSKSKPFSEVGQSYVSNSQSSHKKACDQCDDLYSQGVIKFSEGELREGYEKLTELINQKHKGSRHEKIVKKAVSEIIKKLAETHNPEIPKCLTSVGKEMYLMIVDHLASSGKWRQLDMVVRKYRQIHGSDQLKGFASDLTVVPVIRETSLKAAEDLKLQIVTNILNSGGSLGSDNGQMAVKCAVGEEHFKVLTELVKRGADTRNLSVYEGDTPIHAAMTIVLEKEKSPVILELLLNQFENSPDTHSHLDPEQWDKNGDCLFHLIAKAKFSSYVLKLTEMLCKRNVCANYNNKDGKLPTDYITKKNDRRMQFLRLARTVQPSREQIYGPKHRKKESSSMKIEIDDELHQLPRPADSETNQAPVTEVVKTVKNTLREKRKRNIEELIRLLPDSKHSIFKVEHSPSKRTAIERVNRETDGTVVDIEADTDNYKRESIVYSGTEGLMDNKNDLVDVQDERKNVVAESDKERKKENIRGDAENRPKQPVLLEVDQDNKIGKTMEDLSSGVETIGRKIGNVVKRTLEDVAASFKPKPKEEDVSLSNSLSDTGEGNGTNVDMKVESDSGPPSLEKDQEIQTAINTSENMDESIDEFVDAPEPSSEDEIGETAMNKEDLGHKNNTLAEDHILENITDEANKFLEEKPEDRILETEEHKMKENLEPLGEGDIRPVGMEQNQEVEEQVEEIEVEESGDEDTDDEEEDFEIDVQVFDNLEWEVECTAEVWKTLRDKHVIPELKRRIVRKIQLLASGDWQPHLCKKLKNVPQALNLFEAKFTKGSRIIWELAVAFSPRCSETAERRLQATSGEITQAVRGGRIYSEIIRVWEIVLDHDKIHRSVQRIKKSHQRGETCIIQKKLRGMKGDNPQLAQGMGKRYPMLYAEEDIPDEELEQHHQEMQRFFPPASSNDTEYHILKFYSFSSTLVSHVLQNIETKVDFPFRVTDLEHAIINLRSKAPILLLGRSGTGKTTCCLYRLWSQFHSYWNKAKAADAPLLPRCIEFIHEEAEETSTDEESDNSDDEASDDNSADEANAAAAEGASGCCCSGQEPAEENMIGEQYDHIHQLFITKNAVLSSEVQKNFRELSHADELMREHVQHEEEVLPCRLQDVQDYSFPLFLTSRQLLLMLDASIGPPYFFERKEDWSLKVDIAGWTDLDGPLSFLPLLDEDSDAEEEIEQYEEDDDDDGAGDAGINTGGKKLKLDPRREITYSVFVEEIWPRIRKKLGSNYHPSLMWMEIMSFIKGSYEALSKPCGYLKKEEYIKLGRKRAPNFSGERDSVYSFFVRYEHFKKQNSLFDETDLVHDAFRRLRHLGSRPWAIHQIYVDETQDFTQAELCLLIRLCQNPNDMFLTGDTAQSIMRGISFRFSDLRSLFYHAKQSMQAMGKTSAVEVPKQVYQLTHNYRSHAGILSLATSVLELMVEFFPESFDRMNPDQGLFHGPQPILLESCSFGDLAVLLRGNRRKTSHIEFGAHQAILVVNDAARDTIPEELRLGLVLTIYEAKGLEFDDVLLYNFFKDSQAGKEWRVVTDFLERLADHQKDGGEKQHESLVQIDHNILAACVRPRPLNFDPNLHRVLNSELKHLYTALTRARVNVWIFDEDMEKRAPMFEYFKARMLVKCMHVEEINETSLSETVFAEKSSQADWIRRGDDFMRHSLYGVAAKCFGMGGDHEREKIALAHGQALTASRLKDNPREMREEFLYAAELYMECDRPTKAAICLQNAKERDLAAGLFEKLGQYERAAEIYRKLKRPASSSRCYEQLGNYNKAVEVLYESENFDLAIDTLRRYHMIMKELHQKRSPIPAQLVANKPEAFYTEEKLSHRAAELFHKYKNVEKMLDAVDRFQNINDKVEFLKNKNYIPEAAKILEEDGKLEAAANLLLMYGLLDEATVMAKKTLKEEVIAHCLLVSCRVMLSKKDKIEIHKSSLEQNLKEAFHLFQSCGDNDKYGQVTLLQAELSGNVDSIKFGWKAFSSSKPFSNEAGLVECVDWLIRKEDLGSLQTLQTAVRGIEHIFSLCQALLDPNTQTNMERVQKYDQFYGLGPLTQDKVVIHTKEKPICMRMIQEILKSKSETKKKALEVYKTDVHEAIVVYLLNRAKGWLKPMNDALNKMRDVTRVCDYFQAGLDCPFMGDVDKQCRLLHSVHTRTSFQQLIQLDLLLIEFEGNIQEGASKVKRRCPAGIRHVLDDYLLTENADPNIKYQACVQLWNDLMPASGHSLYVGNESRSLLQYIRRDKVVVHFKRFLLEKWKMFTAGEKKLRSDAARETEVYLLFEFGYHLFGLDTGKRKLERSPEEEMTKLERIFDAEVAAKPNIVRSQRYYTLMMSRDKIYVTCVARRFTDAFSLISKSGGDPFEAMMKFSKFQIQLSQRNTTDYNFYPDLKTYLMWLEFYTCIAIFLISKLKTKNFPDFVFILPSNYFALIQFIQSTFPSSGYSVLELVSWWMPAYHKQVQTESLIYERLKGFSFVVSGHAQEIRILDKLLQNCKEDPCNYAMLERLLILNMTMVCNIGKAVPHESEFSLMSSMSHITLPEKSSERIEHVLASVKTCKGISDVANTLCRLLSKRDQKEELFICKWKMGKKPTLEKAVLQNFSLFEDTFVSENTLPAMHAARVYKEEVTPLESQVEADLDEEEIERGRREKEAQMKKERTNKAVLYVQRMFRAKQELRSLRKANLNKNESSSSLGSLLEGIKVDDNMCGVCGVFFFEKLEARLELEKSVFVGGKSVLNEMQWGAQQGPKQETQDGNQSTWGSSQDNQFQSQELRKLQLKNIRTQHLQESGHIQKCMELNAFKTNYKVHIAPKLIKMNEFLYESAYGLIDQDYVARNYAREQMAIERMKNKSKLIEKEVQLLMISRMWSITAGLIEQKMKELETDFANVRPYVEETYVKLKKEEEERRIRQVAASSSAMSQQGENWEDELDDIEEVVDAPVPRHTREFRNTKHYRGRRKPYH